MTRVLFGVLLLCAAAVAQPAVIVPDQLWPGVVIHPPATTGVRQLWIPVTIMPGETGAVITELDVYRSLYRTVLHYDSVTEAQLPDDGTPCRPEDRGTIKTSLNDLAICAPANEETVESRRLYAWRRMALGRPGCTSVAARRPERVDARTFKLPIGLWCPDWGVYLNGLRQEPQVDFAWTSVPEGTGQPWSAITFARDIADAETVYVDHDNYCTQPVRVTTSVP